MKTFIDWARRHVGQGASVAVTSILLVGCSTAAQQLPKVCAGPESVLRDRKCAAAVDRLPPEEAAAVRDFAERYVRVQEQRGVADSRSDY